MVAVGILAWLAGSADAHKADAPFTVAGRAVPAGAALAGTVEISGGGSVILAAGSRAVADGTAAEPVLRLEHGSADCTVASRSSGRFAVATPHGGMSVIGTAFTVAVGEDTRLSVREGTVEATAGGERLAVGPGGIARLGDAGPPRLYRPLLRTIRVATAEEWNNNGPGTSVTVVGPGPTGYPSVRLDFAAGSWPWASCIWRPGVDWRDADGISLVLTGTGSGRRLELELMDDGPEAMAGGRDGYERFVVGFVDDAIGWHERRFPFTGFARRADLWPGMPNDGFGRERVHGLSLIGPESSARASLQIERIGLYRTR